MQVALYARVSTPNQHQEGTIVSQVRSLRHDVHQQGWSLLPTHEYLDEGISGTRLDRPALDRLRDGAQRGEFDAVVVLSPDRLARHDAHQWLLIEEFAKRHTPVIFLQNPFGDSPQGKRLIQMQGMIAEYERAQILERMSIIARECTAMVGNHAQRSTGKTTPPDRRHSCTTGRRAPRASRAISARALWGPGFTAFPRPVAPVVGGVGPGNCAR
jgi:Resolvase, N terminal domain